MDDPREAVAAERRRRGWSVRRAATEGGVSNTTWGKYEAGQEVAAMIPAVAQAFGWPANWEDTPPVPASPADSLTRRVEVLEKANARLSDEVRSLARQVSALVSRAERDADRRSAQARRARQAAEGAGRSRR